MLIFSVLLSFAGCNEKASESKPDITSDTPSTESKTIDINLLYNKSDSFNPYTAVTNENRNLCKLIFEPLVKTNNDFEPVFRVAKGIEQNEQSIVVSIGDVLFSDGSAVSAGDIVYSFNLAKSTNGLYANHLYEISSAQARDGKTVVFNLTRKDPFIANLLDFPIIKSGTDKNTDSDGVALPPVGCGRYLVSKGKNSLLLNDNFFGNKGNIKSINLINAPDEDSISHYIEVGATELYYSDLSDGKVIRMSGKKAEVNLNNLIYIGINANVSGLDNKYLRYAISSALDRKAISETAFYNNAIPATGYFNPALSAVKAVQTLKNVSDIQITVENLERIGYNSKDSDGYYVNSNGRRLSLRLLVNTENRSRVLAANLIASELKSAGIELKVNEVSYNEYSNAIANNQFELYLGETSVMPNFDMSSLVITGGTAAFGVKDPTPQKDEEGNDIPVPNPNSEIINGYYAGNNSLSDVASTLLTEMVQIPLLYRKGLFFYQDEICGDVVSAESDIYFSIEDYDIK